MSLHELSTFTDLELGFCRMAAAITWIVPIAVGTSAGAAVWGPVATRWGSMSRAPSFPADNISKKAHEAHEVSGEVGFLGISSAQCAGGSKQLNLMDEGMCKKKPALVHWYRLDPFAY